MLIDDDTRAKIRQHQATYAQGVKRIQNNPDLSAEGKRKQLAVLKHHTQQTIDALVRAAAENYERHVSGLERQIFGIHDIPNDVQAAIAWRDAQDRVAQIKTADEARQMMRRSIRSGDGLLARALFERAWDVAGNALLGSGWGDIVNLYLNKLRPDLADTVRELAALRNADNPRQHIAQQMETSLFTPPELAGMSVADAQQAASEAGDAPGPSTEHLNPGAGEDRPQSAREAWAKFVEESRSGAYGA